MWNRRPERNLLFTNDEMLSCGSECRFSEALPIFLDKFDVLSCCVQVVRHEREIHGNSSSSKTSNETDFETKGKQC